MHQLAARNGRDQGRLLQYRKPEIGKTGQAEPEQFRQQDIAHGRPAADGERARGLQIGAIQRAQNAEKDLAGIGREDEAKSEAAGQKAVELEIARGAGGTGQQVQNPLAAEIDDEQRQQFGNAAKDPGEGGGGFVEPGMARMTGKGERQAAGQTQRQCREGQEQGVDEPES